MTKLKTGILMVLVGIVVVGIAMSSVSGYCSENSGEEGCCNYVNCDSYSDGWCYGGYCYHGDGTQQQYCEWNPSNLKCEGQYLKPNTCIYGYVSDDYLHWASVDWSYYGEHYNTYCNW